MKKHGYTVLTFCFFSIFVLIVYLTIWSQKSFYAPTVENRYFELNSHESLNSLSEKLYRRGLISSVFLFKLLVRLKYNYKNFKAGNYLILDEKSPNQIVRIISKGKTYNPLVFKLIIPEGFSLPQIINRLEARGYDRKELSYWAYAKDFIGSLEIQSQSLEGYLYPSTYSFYNEKPTIKEIYQTLVAKFFKMLPTDYISRVGENDFSLHESVIIASLIEKETSLKSEKPLIAEVILNRLKKKMTLGIDASLIYGIENFDGNLTYKHLKDHKNLYNTRVYYGLPPGPICNPSKSSLQALLKPTQEGYLFYVLKSGKNQKAHHFSRDLREHNYFVKQLIRK